ncbi:NAD(P)H-binding protein [Streptomyces sp. NPDC051987]|uniref:NAD(P)H-binding protein n=1 Tax=Streptomyces sp. NPDC051987 TaxID=3155808 RepID=UPI00342C022A
MRPTVFCATGAIGRLVVQQLLDDGHQVTALVRTPPSSHSPTPVSWSPPGSSPTTMPAHGPRSPQRQSARDVGDCWWTVDAHLWSAISLTDRWPPRGSTPAWRRHRQTSCRACDSGLGMLTATTYDTVAPPFPHSLAE